MKAKTIVIAILVAAGLQMLAATPTVSDVVARQRYPWNGMVDIDYTITGDAVGLKLEIGVEDRQNGKTYTPTKFLSVLPTSMGRHRVTWSTEAEGVTIISTNVAVTVSLVQVDPAYQKKNLYYVVDLSGGPTATSFPVTTLEAPYSAEWSDEYKTSKLVLRRIEAGDDPLKRYTITKPFYIGVFEVTQKQYELIMENNPVWWDEYKGDMRAVNCVSYDMIRGDSSGAGWPSSADIDPGCFLSQLRNKTGIDFELPTSAQWEYSCRAGTTSKYNNGGDNEADLRTLGRFAGNNNDGRGGFSSVAIVGSYAPNAWGLYDMHGNVDEWCLDWYSYSAYSELCGSDPVGPVEPSGDRVFRGGNWDENRSASSDVGRHYSSRAYSDIGFRLVCPAGK